MLRRLGLALLVLPVLLLSGEGAATILAQSQACYSNGLAQQCWTSPADTGPGATTNELQTLTFGGGVFQGSAGAAVQDFDHFAVRAGGAIDFELGPAGGQPFLFHGMGGRAFVDLRDTLTVGGATGSGIVRMQWSITGANDIGFVGSDSVLSVNHNAGLMMTCGSQSGSTFLNCTDADFDWSVAGGFDELVTIDVEIIFGTPIDWILAIQLSASIGVQFEACTLCVHSFHGRNLADFASTGRLVDVQLFDGLGNELDPSHIQAESMFRYDLVGQNVTEPLVLALAAPLALAAARRRRA